ncbi:MAG: mRNA surveillance protein pelota [Candidatus Aenigmatarchaeota archaeon]
MKILDSDEKEGMLKLKVENPNDVWELDNVLEEGDFVNAKTMRRKMIDREEGQEKGNKRPVYLTLKIDKMKFHEHTGNLRLTGPIVDGPEDVEIDNYHTIVAEPGKVLTIVKEDGWKEWQMRTIRRAYKKPPEVLVCVLDREEATIARVSNGKDIITTVRSGGSGKQYEGGDDEEYLGEVASIIRRREENFDKIVVAGPGFVKDKIYKMLEEDLSEKSVKANTSHSGTTGVEEVIKRGVIEKVVEDSRISDESSAVERLLEEFSKDSGEVAYGIEDVDKAVEMGAVKKILVSEKKLKDLRDLVNKAEERGAEVMIISARHEGGEKLSKIGGIAALLRYRIK